MIDKIMRFLGEEKIDNIKIKESFKMHPPRYEKMLIKKAFYMLVGKFEQPIVLDSNNYLIDGYTTYLIAKELNKRYVAVKRISL